MRSHLVQSVIQIVSTKRDTVHPPSALDAFYARAFLVEPGTKVNPLDIPPYTPRLHYTLRNHYAVRNILVPALGLPDDDDPGLIVLSRDAVQALRNACDAEPGDNSIVRQHKQYFQLCMRKALMFVNPDTDVIGIYVHRHTDLMIPVMSAMTNGIS